jgi:hypothetical protein
VLALLWDDNNEGGAGADARFRPFTPFFFSQSLNALSNLQRIVG